MKTAKEIAEQYFQEIPSGYLYQYFIPKLEQVIRYERLEGALWAAGWLNKNTPSTRTHMNCEALMDAAQEEFGLSFKDLEIGDQVKTAIMDKDWAIRFLNKEERAFRALSLPHTKKLVERIKVLEGVAIYARDYVQDDGIFQADKYESLKMALEKLEALDNENT